MVTGEKPFPGENITTVIFKIINEEPIPPRKLDPSIHPGLSAVITRALAKEPTARFQNCAEMLAALRNYRNFGGKHAEDPQATIPDNFGQSSYASYPAPPFPSPPPTVPLTAMGHTVYEPPKPRRFWPSFWLTIFLLGVIGVTGYYVLPSARDVWSVVKTNVTHPANPPKTAPTVAPPANPGPVAPPRSRSGNPSGVSPSNKMPATSNLSSAPPQKAKVDAADETAKDSAASTGRTSAAPAPPAGSQPADLVAPSVAALIGLKEKIERKLTDANLAERVHVSVEGDGLILDGRLHPAEHQMLVNQLRQLPDWAHVTDDILYDNTPIATPTGAAGAPAAGTGVTITSQPDHAFIFINGERQESTTPATLSLAPGKYNVIIREPNFAPYLSQIEVRQGETAHVNVSFTGREHGEGATMGFVNVTSTPPGAEIRVDGKATGQRTPAQIEMTAGQHTIALWSGGKVLYRRNVIVEANQVAQFNGTAQQ